jgi:hypothetical protein
MVAADVTKTEPCRRLGAKPIAHKGNALEKALQIGTHPNGPREDDRELPVRLGLKGTFEFLRIEAVLDELDRSAKKARIDVDTRRCHLNHMGGAPYHSSRERREQRTEPYALPKQKGIAEVRDPRHVIERREPSRQEQTGIR